MDKLTTNARKIIREMLLEMRSGKQGGYIGYGGDGKWSFVSTGVGPVEPQDLNTLFEFAGIVPDRIVPLGLCSACGNAQVLDDGRRVERGYREPCDRCLRPKNDCWIPVAEAGK